MKLNHLTTMLAILAAFAFAGCGEEESTTTEATPTAETSPAAEEATEEAAEEGSAAEPAAEQPAQAEGQGGGSGGSVCERAVSCCEAYVNAVAATTPGVTAETTCAGVRQAGAAPGGDAACTAAIQGWRQSLTQLNQEVPAPCAE